MRFGLSLTFGIIASLLIATAAADVRSADAEMFAADTQFDASIPTPEQFLGFRLGDEPVRHHQLIDYIRHVAALSDRLTVETIGYSHERRPILFVVATSPDNHARLDDIRLQHIALTEPSSNQSVESGMPVVTWLNYGVHGAESSGMDAALPFVYHLAAAQGNAIERVLDESVVLVTAIFQSGRTRETRVMGGCIRRQATNCRSRAHRARLRLAFRAHESLFLRSEPAVVAPDAAGAARMDAQVARVAAET